MSARHRGAAPSHVEHPARADRSRDTRAVRRSTKTALHKSLVEDPELVGTALPEPRKGTVHFESEEEPRTRSRRLRHWKTRDWKRRSARRRRKAEIAAAQPV